MSASNRLKVQRKFCTWLKNFLSTSRQFCPDWREQAEFPSCSWQKSGSPILTTPGGTWSPESFQLVAAQRGVKDDEALPPPLLRSNRTHTPHTLRQLREGTAARPRLPFPKARPAAARVLRCTLRQPREGTTARPRLLHPRTLVPEGRLGSSTCCVGTFTDLPLPLEGARPRTGLAVVPGSTFSLLSVGSSSVGAALARRSWRRWWHCGGGRWRPWRPRSSGITWPARTSGALWPTGASRWPPSRTWGHRRTSSVAAWQWHSSSTQWPSCASPTVYSLATCFWWRVMAPTWWHRVFRGAATWCITTAVAPWWRLPPPPLLPLLALSALSPLPPLW